MVSTVGKSQREIEESLEVLLIEKEREVRAIAAALASLRGGSAVTLPSVDSVLGEYTGLGIVEAAERWIAEVGKPQSTRELADGMRSKGWRTSSARPVQAIYATLTNAPRKFKRTEDGAWRLTTDEERRLIDEEKRRKQLSIV